MSHTIRTVRERAAAVETWGATPKETLDLIDREIRLRRELHAAILARLRAARHKVIRSLTRNRTITRHV